MKRKRALTLIELLVSSVLLLGMTASIGYTYFSIRSLSNEITYHYTALNLAKEVLEFGEAGRLTHAFGFKYYHPSPTSNTIPAFTPCEAKYSGISGTTGYGLKERRCFDLNNPLWTTPFTYLGDIKAKGLVPKKAPDSVVIYYTVDADPGFFNEFKEEVEVSWREEIGGPLKKETLSVVPIRSVNDQLNLDTAEFWWE